MKKNEGGGGSDLPISWRLKLGTGSADLPQSRRKELVELSSLKAEGGNWMS